MQDRPLGWEAVSSANELGDESGKVGRVISDEPVEDQLIFACQRDDRIGWQVERLWRRRQDGLIWPRS